MKNFKIRFLLLATAATLALFSAACRMSVHDGKSGEDSKVEIKSPFGQLKVNTDVDSRDTGIALYPGAQPFEDQNSKDKHGANVNISSTLFGIKVVVKEYRSNDSFEQVRDFYRKELQRYGKVLECTGTYDQNVSVDKNGDDDDNSAVTCGDDHDKSGALQLKTGTKRRQHVVGLKPDGSGTRFALVYVNVRGKDEGI